MIKDFKTILRLLDEYNLVNSRVRERIVEKMDKKKAQHKIKKEKRNKEMIDKIKLLDYPVGVTDEIKMAIDQYNEPLIAEQVRLNYEIKELYVNNI